MILPAGYGHDQRELKERVRSVQVQVQANRQLTTVLEQLSWSIGGTILEQQKSDGWGSGIVERLANDLRAEFVG